MSDTLRIVLIIGLLAYFFVVFNLLKKKRMKLKYTLLWILMGVIMLVLLVIPELLEVITNALGIVSAVNGLFTFAVGFLILLTLVLTSIVSTQSEKIKALVQSNALLEKRMRDLENKSDNQQKEE